MGDVSLEGLSEIFSTPKGKTPKAKTPTPGSAASSVATPHSLYSDIPDTPNGPGEMMVSPMSASFSSKRKSVATPKLIGVKQLFSRKSPKSNVVSPAGLQRIMKTPKQTRTRKSVSPAGLKRMLKTPKQKKTEPSSPSGVADLFKVKIYLNQELNSCRFK